MTHKLGLILESLLANGMKIEVFDLVDFRDRPTGGIKVDRRLPTLANKGEKDYSRKNWGGERLKERGPGRPGGLAPTPQ